MKEMLGKSLTLFTLFTLFHSLLLASDTQSKKFEDDAFKQMEQMMERQEKAMRALMDDFHRGDSLGKRFGNQDRIDLFTQPSLGENDLIFFEEKEVGKGKVEYRIAPKVEGVELEIQCKDNRISVEGTRKIKREEKRNGVVISSSNQTSYFSNSFPAHGVKESSRSEGKTYICTYANSEVSQNSGKKDSPPKNKVKKKQTAPEEKYELFRPQKGEATI